MEVTFRDDIFCILLFLNMHPIKLPLVVAYILPFLGSFFSLTGSKLLCTNLLGMSKITETINVELLFIERKTIFSITYLKENLKYL